MCFEGGSQLVGETEKWVIVRLDPLHCASLKAHVALSVFFFFFLCRAVTFVVVEVGQTMHSFTALNGGQKCVSWLKGNGTKGCAVYNERFETLMQLFFFVIIM